jgi:hypothetical protein
MVIGFKRVNQRRIVKARGGATMLAALKKVGLDGFGEFINV